MPNEEAQPRASEWLRDATPEEQERFRKRGIIIRFRKKLPPNHPSVEPPPPSPGEPEKPSDDEPNRPTTIPAQAGAAGGVCIPTTWGTSSSPMSWNYVSTVSWHPPLSTSSGYRCFIPY